MIKKRIKNVVADLQSIDWTTLLKRTWQGAIAGYGGNRMPRYTVIAAGGVGGIWLLALAYLVFTPKSYVGEFTLILPGAGAGASINLNAIGQASSLSESAFSNARVSPTESYKRLLLSDRMIDTAKEIADVDWFPKPRVKLLDQTQFMEISVNAGSQAQAEKFAISLEAAFMSEVDRLRAEERAQREKGYRGTLSEFEETVSQARTNLLRHQTASGLASIEQYNERIASVDGLAIDQKKA